MPMSTPINLVSIWHEQFEFASIGANENFQTSLYVEDFILPPELFFNISIISTVGRNDMSKVTKFFYTDKFIISEPDTQQLILPIKFLISEPDTQQLIFPIKFPISERDTQQLIFPIKNCRHGIDV